MTEGPPAIEGPPQDTLSGYVISPGNPARAETVHAFANVVRELIHRTMLYKTEGEKLAAIAAVTEWEKLGVPDLSAVHTQSDRADVEDVGMRRGSNVSGTLAEVVPDSGTHINYDELAAALMRQQQQIAGNQ